MGSSRNDQFRHPHGSTLTAKILLMLILDVAWFAASTGVTKVDIVTAYQDINADTLTGDVFSTDTKIMLHRFDFLEQCQQDRPGSCRC
jgi:hypothetical protein